MVEGLSLDLSVGHTGPVPATRDNLVNLLDRTLIDIGARYAFKLGTTPASLRLSVSNVFDTFAFELQGEPRICCHAE